MATSRASVASVANDRSPHEARVRPWAGWLPESQMQAGPTGRGPVNIFPGTPPPRGSPSTPRLVVRNRIHLLFGSLLLVVGVANSGYSAASWPPEGLLVCTACRARLPFIISDGTGGAYVIWTEARDYASSNEDLYMQRVAAAGEIAPGWPPDGVAVSTAPEVQSPGHRYGFVLDGLGGVIVAWSDTRDLNTPNGTSADIYAQRMLGNGTIAPGWPANGLAISRRPGYEFLPALLPDGAGGAY